MYGSAIESIWRVPLLGEILSFTELAARANDALSTSTSVKDALRQSNKRAIRATSQNLEEKP